MQRRALIVDNEPANRGVILKAVNSAGMDAITLTKWERASAFLQEEKFDLVVVHMHNGGRDELSVAHEARRSEFNRRTPVILISDDRDPGALVRGFEAGASFFLYNPTETAGLLRLIRAASGTEEGEKRQTRRVPFEARAEALSGREFLEGKTVDISLCGFLMKAPRTLPVGTRVWVNLYLSQRMNPLAATGSVARITPRGEMGIHLNKLTVGESIGLQEFLLRMIPPVRMTPNRSA